MSFQNPDFYYQMIDHAHQHDLQDQMYQSHSDESLGNIPWEIGIFLAANGFCQPKSSLTDDEMLEKPEAELVEKHLWNKFSEFGNEMIVTKCGRRMVPAFNVKFKGLDKASKYLIAMDINPVDSNCYKYDNSKWMIAGKGDPVMPKPINIHSDLLATGEEWMKKGANFHKIKLTNSVVNRPGYTTLNLMHKYQPRLHIVKVKDGKLITSSFTTIIFPQTEFIAVQTYQNAKIIQLKIKHNPFVKTYRKDTVATAEIQPLSFLREYLTQLFVAY